MNPEEIQGFFDHFEYSDKSNTVKKAIYRHQDLNLMNQDLINKLDFNYEIGFKDISFNDNNHLENIFFEDRIISFDNCYFIDKIDLKLKNCSLKFYNSRSNENTKFGFKNKISVNLLYILRGKFSTLKLNNVNAKQVEIINLSADLVDFHCSDSIDHLKIYSISIDSYKLKSIIIFHSNIKVISLKELKGIESVYIKRSFSDKININNLYDNGKIRIVDFHKGILNLDNVSFNEFSLELKNIFQKNIEKLIFNQCKFDKFEITNPREKIIIKELSLNDIPVFNLIGLSILKLSITGTVKFESKIINCLTSNISFLDFLSEKKLFFKNQSIEGNHCELELVGSVFDNVVLSPSFLDKFEKVRFVNSSISNLQALNLTNIPLSSISPIKRDAETNYLILYRELKSIAHNYGDTYLYHKFKALEYNERLNSKEDIGTINRIILWCNKFSNNHSTKPQYAFGGIVAISLFFSVPIIISLYSNGVKLSANQIWSSLTYFVNPLKFLNEYSIRFHGIIYFLEIIYKVILGYLIYQMIAAFRKFNR